MPSKITPHHTAEELVRLARLKENRAIADRIHAIRLAMQGMRPPEICTVLGRKERWYYDWRKRYNEHGLEGLRDLPRPGQPKKLGDEERQELKAQVLEGPCLETDGVSTWNGEAIQARIERCFGVRYSVTQVYRICHQLGLSWITPRPKHPKSDPEKQEEWKEELPLSSRKSRRRTPKKK